MTHDEDVRLVRDSFDGYYCDIANAALDRIEADYQQMKRERDALVQEHEARDIHDMAQWASWFGHITHPEAQLYAEDYYAAHDNAERLMHRD